MVSTLTNRSGRRGRTARDIIEPYRLASIRAAALKVIARRGLAATTMDEVAAEAGVAKGTLYLYFKNREALLDKAVDHAIDELGHASEAALVKATGPENGLQALIRAELEFLDANRPLLQAYFAARDPAEACGVARRHRTRSTRYAAHLDRLAAFLRAAMNAGRLRESDPERLALFVSEGVHGILLKRLYEPNPPTVDQEVAWLVSVVMHGLAPTRHSPVRRTP
jgi:AcrR family transcriptional regulator